MKKARLKCQSVPRFFGLTPENKDVILEQIFVLMQQMGFSYADAYRLPVWKRTWFMGKLKEQIESRNNVPQNAINSQNRNNIFKRQF